MKKILLILFLSPVFCYAQKEMIVNGNPVQYEKIITLDSTVKKGLVYTKSLEWLATNYNSAKAVIQVQDKEEGLVLGKAIVMVPLKLGGLYGAHDYKVDYTIKIACRDGKVKITLFDFASSEGFGALKDGEITQYPNPIGKGVVKKVYIGLVDYSKSYSEHTIEDFGVFMKKSLTKDNF